MPFRLAIAFLALACVTFARAKSVVSPSFQGRISCGEAYRIALETALTTMPEPLSDRDACRIVSSMFNGLSIPGERIGASVIRTNGTAIVTVVFEAIEGYRPRSEHVFMVDEKTRTILPDPELSDALDPGGPLSEKKALCIVSERLHGMWFGGKGNVATSVTNLPGRTRVVLTYRESGDQQSTLREGMPLAVVEIDEATRKTISNKGTLSDDKAIEIAKEIAKRDMPGRTPPEEFPFLVDHVGGITVVGFPRLIGLRGRQYDASQGDFPMEFDPTLWIHDATGELISGIEEPD